MRPIEAILESKEHQELIVEAIETLDPALSRIVFQHYYADMTIEQIADGMGVSESTVYRNLNKALKELKPLLENKK